ncbi:MAG TPA: hypothetical protein VGS19_25240 [Streptosporangiaceae bacterium]|nr:hypothetical protein [Streptosporangiaceae bacterium]
MGLRERCDGCQCWLWRVSHECFVVGEWFKPGFGAALVQPLRLLNRPRPEYSVGDGELGAVQLRLPGVDPDPILQVGEVRW